MRPTPMDWPCAVPHTPPWDHPMPDHFLRHSLPDMCPTLMDCGLSNVPDGSVQGTTAAVRRIRSGTTLGRRGLGMRSRRHTIIGAMHPVSDPSDEHLMRAYADGDAHAFERLYDRHHLSVWRFVQRSVQNTALADDIVQDVWFRVVRQAPLYKPLARFRTWLFTIAHHRIVDHWRSHKNHSSLDAETDEGAALADTLAAKSGFGPERQLGSREQAQALLDALAALPDVQREAFLLQAEADMSVAEIAQTTGVTTETAKSRLRYARARLRDTLEAFA